MANINEDYIRSWVHTFETNQYEDICEAFFDETRKCVEKISEWVNNETKKCEETNNFQSIKKIYYEAHKISGKKAVEYLLNTPLAVKDSRNDSEWILNNAGKDALGEEEIAQFLNLLTNASYYYKENQDILSFCNYVLLTIEKTIKKMNTLIKDLWTINIKQIKEKGKSWFPDIETSVDAAGDFNIFELHPQLFKKYMELKATTNNITESVHQLEKIGGINDLVRIDHIDKWLTVIEQFCFKDMTETTHLQNILKGLLEKSFEQHETYVKVLRDTTLSPKMKTYDMLKIWGNFYVCFDKKISAMIKTVEKTFDFYHAENKNQTVSEFDVTFRTYRRHFIEVLNFEQIKYMYIMLLTLKFIDVTNDPEEIIESNKEKYLHIMQIYHQHALLNNINAADGHSIELSQNGVMTYQIKQLNYILNTFYISHTDLQRESVSDKLKFDFLDKLRSMMLEEAPALELETFVIFKKKQKLIGSILSIICHSSD